MSRIRLHMHLFTSLLLHAIISALLKWHLLRLTLDQNQSQQSPLDESSSHHQPSFCLVLSVLLRYFRSTNYLWMFNEALYLHQLIKHAFSQPSLRPLIILAYSLPFITTTSYIFARFFSVTDIIDTDAGSQSDPTSAQLTTDYSLSRQVEENSDAYRLLHRHRQQLNGQVEEALTSLIRLPHFQKHFRESVESQPEFLPRSANSRSWFNDLLPSSNGAAAATAARLVSSDADDDTGSHKFPPFDDTGDEHVLAAMEDVSPLVEEDNCWLMPSYRPWHEWIINVPNLAILIVSPLPPILRPISGVEAMSHICVHIHQWDDL